MTLPQGGIDLKEAALQHFVGVPQKVQYIQTPLQQFFYILKFLLTLLNQMFVNDNYCSLFKIYTKEHDKK